MEIYLYWTGDRMIICKYTCIVQETYRRWLKEQVKIYLYWTGDRMSMWKFTCIVEMTEVSSGKISVFYRWQKDHVIHLYFTGNKRTYTCIVQVTGWSGRNIQPLCSLQPSPPYLPCAQGFPPSTTCTLQWTRSVLTDS